MTNQPQTQGAPVLYIQLSEAVESLEKCCARWETILNEMDGREDPCEPSRESLAPLPPLFSVLKDSPSRIQGIVSRMKVNQNDLEQLLKTGERIQ